MSLVRLLLPGCRRLVTVVRHPYDDGGYRCDLLFLHDPSATEKQKEIQKSREALKNG